MKITDDDFEVVISQGHEWHHFLKFVGAVMVNRLNRLDSVVVTRAGRVDVAAPDDDAVHVQADGEPLGILPASIGTLPDALTLLVPKKYLAR